MKADLKNAVISFRYFGSYKESDFARSGFIANETVTLETGPVSEFLPSMEAYLRTKLGLPTSLQGGVVHLIKPFTVCTGGTPLTPEQAKLLVRTTMWFTFVCLTSCFPSSLFLETVGKRDVRVLF